MVKLYTKDNCKNCNHTKRMLKASNIEFEELNIKDEDNFNFVKNELHFSNMPVIVADGFEPFQFNKQDVSDFIKAVRK